jgi:hypothetical protein
VPVVTRMRMLGRLVICAVGTRMTVAMIGHISQRRTPCPATSVLGSRDTAYQAVVKSLVKLNRIVTERLSRPKT